MSASKAKPVGRAVRIRKCVDEMLFTPGSYCVEGYTGSAKKLKRLVEIAGMDEEAFIAYSVNHGFSEFGARLAYEALGLGSPAASRTERTVRLSTAQGRKGKRS